MQKLYHGQLPFLRFRSFPDNGRVQHAIFTRQGGVSPQPYESLNLSVSVADDPANVFANRWRAYGTHDRDNDTLVHAYLVHGDDVALVAEEDYGRYVGPVDGLITDRPGCGLTMNYADCSPIMIYDPVHRAIGLGHAGWQGVVKDLPGALVRAMQQAFDSDPRRLVAGIGPSIGPCCYQIGEVVISAVEAAFEDPESLLLPSTAAARSGIDGRRCNFDLPGGNKTRLADAGVKQIEQSELCTACRNDLFFFPPGRKGTNRPVRRLNYSGHV
jgi:YfiH family protein